MTLNFADTLQLITDTNPQNLNKGVLKDLDDYNIMWHCYKGKEEYSTAFSDINTNNSKTYLHNFYKNDILNSNISSLLFKIGVAGAALGN